MSKVWLTTGPLNFVTDKPDRIGSCGRKDKARPMKRHEVARIGALIRATSCDLVWIVLLAGSGTLVRAIDARPRGRLDLGFLFQPRAVRNFFGERREDRLPFLTHGRGEKHALRFEAAELTWLEIGNNSDLASDQLLWFVVKCNSGEYLTRLVFSKVHRQQ